MQLLDKSRLTGSAPRFISIDSRTRPVPDRWRTERWRMVPGCAILCRARPTGRCLLSQDKHSPRSDKLLQHRRHLLRADVTQASNSDGQKGERNKPVTTAQSSSPVGSVAASDQSLARTHGSTAPKLCSAEVPRAALSNVRAHQATSNREPQLPTVACRKG